MATVGTGKYTYEVHEDWARLPDGMTFGNVASVAVDSQDRLYAFQRKDPPVLIFDRDGNFLSSWGNGAIAFGHGIYIGPDDFIYITDWQDHVVLKFTLNGKPLLILGNRSQPSDTGCEEPGGTVLRAAGPFNRPAQMVTSPSGNVYVSDGYSNCRIHRFTPQGRLISSWGEPGKVAPNELHVPHCVWVDREGTVFVCDRDNSRIQVFSADGEFIAMWTEGLFRPTSIYIDAQETVYLSELSPDADVSETGGKISIWDKKGNNLARLPAPATHWVFGDSRGDIYAAKAYATGVTKYVKTG